MSEYNRNHILSECLLARFQNADGEIIRHDIFRDKDKRTKPGLEGFRIGLWTKSNAANMEKLWNQQAESDIQKVFAKVDARKYLSRNELETLIRFCAIHFIRSNEFIKVYANKQRETAQEIKNDPRLDFADRYIVRNNLLKKTKMPSVIFENAMEFYYHRSVQYLKNFKIEIGIATGKENLILPDGGLILSRTREDRYQPSGGVSLMSATEAVLPLGPKLLLGFSNNKRRVTYIELDDQNVININYKLLKGCNSFYYKTPL